MRFLIYMVALAALIGWAVGVFIYKQGGIFHYFLVIAIVAFVLGVIGGDRLFRYQDDSGKF